MSEVWSFKAGRVRVALEITRLPGYRYDGHDPGKRTQRELDRGDLVAFDSKVLVTLDGKPVGVDYLGGSVYHFGKESEFWTAHRDRNPANRNCSLNPGVSVGHYFPDMVHEAIRDARARLKVKGRQLEHAA